MSIFFPTVVVQSWTFILGEGIPLQAYPSTALSLVVIEHEVELHLDLGAEANRERADVRRAESQGEDSISHGEVLKHSSS